jgi:hypothetical protein
MHPRLRPSLPALLPTAAARPLAPPHSQTWPACAGPAHCPRAHLEASAMCPPASSRHRQAPGLRVACLPPGHPCPAEHARPACYVGLCGSRGTHDMHDMHYWCVAPQEPRSKRPPCRWHAAYRPSQQVPCIRDVVRWRRVQLSGVLRGGALRGGRGCSSQGCCGVACHHVSCLKAS